MIAKLFIVALFIATAFVAVSEAAMAATTYEDSSCTTAIGFYSSNRGCPVAKRSVEQSCYSLKAGGPYVMVDECNGDVADPTTQPPNGFQYYKFSNVAPCDFSTYEIIGTLSPQPTDVAVYFSSYGSYQLLNATITCDSINGVMSVQSCFAIVGCSVFDSIPDNVCSNLTTGIQSQTFYNAIQTSCVAPQAPMDAPIAVPKAAPKAATVAAPAKRSESVTLAVGSVVTFVATTATLLC